MTAASLLARIDKVASGALQLVLQLEDGEGARVR